MGRVAAAPIAVLGILDFSASLIAGLLWDGLPALGLRGFGAPAPFFFGGAMALLAAVAMWQWRPVTSTQPGGPAEPV